MADTTAPKIRKALRYELSWMDSTFRPRSTAEALLSPERETGNLSAHDYDASVSFFSNYHRQYPLVGALAATAFFCSIRKKKWSQTKTLGLAFGAGLAGHGIGRLYSTVAHFKYLNSLDNPYGFQKAIQHVQAQVGSPKGPGLVIEFVYQVSPDDLDPDEKTDTSTNLILPSASNPRPDRSPNTQTKWDEIRSASNRSAQNSTWDSIRQQHERKGKGVKPRPGEDETLWPDNATGKVDTDRYANPDTYDDGDKYNDGHQNSSRT